MRFTWADCELDREARELRRAGALVRTQPLVLDLLLLLVQHRGRVISEDHLRRALWGDVRVTDASLRRLVKEARRALGDDGERQEQIQTLRGRGIRFAAEVAVADGWDTSFVGRADLLDIFERQLAEVAGGVGGLTLLHGPAGIGKTRALVELETRAAAAGFRVLNGCGRADAQADAFHPWLDAASEIGSDVLSGAASAGARERSADALRFASFRAFAQALARAASERPLLVVLDDLQLADRDSIALLRFVAPTLPHARVLVLGSYRRGGRTSDWSLRELATLAADSATQAIELGGLDPEELRRLVRSQVRADLRPSLAVRIAQRTSGNPLFALEIARSLLREHGSLELEPTPELEASLARGLEPLVARRLSVLSSDTQAVLRAASALGTMFDADVVRAAENVSARALARALGEGEGSGLLVASGARRWRFAHPLFAEALYADLEGSGEGNAAAQHLRLAEALEQLRPGDAFAIARHFLRARPRADAARVLGHARTAAAEAWRRYAFADAEVWYREAIVLAEEAGASAGELSDLHLGLGETLIAGSGVIPARASLDEAAKLAGRASDPRRLARAALAYAHRPFGFAADAAVTAWLRTARSTPSGDASLDARVASRLGAELMHGDPVRRAEGETLLAEGVAAARALDDPFVLGRVLYDLSSSQFTARDPQGALALVEEVERCAHATGDMELEFRGMHARAAQHLELGDRDGLEAARRDCQRFTRDHPSPYTRAVTQQIEAMRALLDGRLGDASRAIEASEHDARQASSLGLMTIAALQRLGLAIEEDRVADALPALEAGRARFPGLVAAAGLANALEGRNEAARAALAEVVGGLSELPFNRGRLPVLALAAEIAYRTRSAPAAEALLPELAPYAALSAVIGNAAAYFGSVSHALGWLAAARGDTTGAIEHFRTGLRAHEALRSPTWAKRSTAAIAEVTDGRVTLLRA